MGLFKKKKGGGGKKRGSKASRKAKRIQNSAQRKLKQGQRQLKQKIRIATRKQKRGVRKDERLERREFKRKSNYEDFVEKYPQLAADEAAFFANRPGSVPQKNDPLASRWDPIAQVWRSPKRTLASVTARRADRLLKAKNPKQAERRRKRFEKAWEREQWEQGREGRRAERKEEKKIKREERREALAEYYGNLPRYQTLDGRPLQYGPTAAPGSGIVRRGFNLDYAKHNPRAYKENIQAYGYS